MAGFIPHQPLLTLPPIIIDGHAGYRVKAILGQFVDMPKPMNDGSNKIEPTYLHPVNPVL